jgi:hypothetical protein
MHKKLITVLGVSIASLSFMSVAQAAVVSLSSTEFLDFANGNATISLHGGGKFGNLTIGVPTGSTLSDLDFATLFTGGRGGDVTSTAYSGKTEIGTATLDIGVRPPAAFVHKRSPDKVEIEKVFNYDNPAIDEISRLDPVPLPGAFAMFGTVLFGGLVVSSWRKRRGPRSAVSVLGPGI